MTAIPIFLFHRVGSCEGCRMTVPLATFERYLQIVVKEGYRTLTCTDLKDIIESGIDHQDQMCLLTFDDGYLDFWTYVVPMLHKYECKATVFILLSRTNNSPVGHRPTLEDVWAGKCSMDALYRLPNLHAVNSMVLDPAYVPVTDHLAWGELQLLIQDDLIDVQSHTDDHLTHFAGSRLIGFLHPASHWTVWAAARYDARLGVPIYEVNSVLVGPRYIDPPALRNRLAQYVHEGGGAVFFKKTYWRELLERECTRVEETTGKGEYENRDAWAINVTRKLSECSRQMLNHLGTAPHSVAWPFGRCSSETVRLAESVGYRLGFTAKCGGYVPGMSPMLIGRISLKDNDTDAFRRALYRYSQPDNIWREYRSAVYTKPLGYPREGFNL